MLRQLLPGLLAIWAALGGIPALAAETNVLFILMDDLGYGHLGINNRNLQISDFDPFFVEQEKANHNYSLEKALEFTHTATPTITHLAENGLLFSRAHASSNVCAPSRLGIATGTLQNRFGVFRNGDVEAQGLIKGKHLAANFKRRGYATAHIGKWHIGAKNPDLLHGKSKKGAKQGKKSKPTGYRGSVADQQHPLNNGFDYYFGYNNHASEFYGSDLVWEDFTHTGIQKDYNTDVFTDKALDFIKKSLDKKNPFFLQLHYHAVHDKLEPRAPDLYLNRFDSDNHHLNNFYAHLYGADHNISRVVDFLKSRGQYENTLIIFSSDNGAMCKGAYGGLKTGSPLPANAPFAGHKGMFNQGGVRVPMFIHWPNGITRPGTTDQMVSTLDILPTAIDATGGVPPVDIDGRSLTPLFANPQKEIIHDYLVWAGSLQYHQGFSIQKTNRTPRTISGSDPPSWVIIKGDYLLRFTGTLPPDVYLNLPKGREPIFELFNIKSDPAERRNIAKNFPELTKQLANTYFDEAKTFQAPEKWESAKWQELRDSNSLFD